ncbi:MAG: tRNA uridine-5-carboxymethylaminomethyl(34) synthesis GTPase MnmE [bacterium]
MLLERLHDTICALSTPVGKSAISVIRITGNDAIRVASRTLAHPEKIFLARGGTTLYTNLIDADGNTIDDVIVGVFRAPYSYTGEDLVEIHTHGSVPISQLAERSLIAAGARPAEPGEFSRRAFIHGKISLADLELLSMKIDASSEHQLTNVEYFVQKKFERLKNIYQSLIALLAQVNAQIDFGESDQIELEGLELQVQLARQALETLLAEAAGRQMNKGFFSISLIGAPNVGKSSLFNTLLHYERSIVNETPGTTRDYVEAFITISGFRVKLIDTAGLRDGAETIESIGIALGRAAADDSDMKLRISSPDNRNLISTTGEIIVHNKSDLDDCDLPLSVSAKNGNGIADLIAFITKYLRDFDSQNSSYSISESERSLAREVLTLLDSIIEFDDITLLAEDLRKATDIIASLIGFNINSDSLDHIFLKMCIGK